MGYGLQIEDVIKPPPERAVTRVLETGELTLDDQSLCDAISKRSEWGSVSPLAPDLGRCRIWTPVYETTKENRGYPMIRPVPNGHNQYVYRVYERALCGFYGNDPREKWLTHPRCRNKKCINPEHWAKG